MKTMITTLLALLLTFSAQAYAEDTGADYEMAEVHRSTIRVGADGTGVITRIQCEVCDFTVVNITEDTMAYVGGRQMTPAQALRNSKGKIAVAKFLLGSKEVIEFRFFN